MSVWLLVSSSNKPDTFVKHSHMSISIAILLVLIFLKRDAYFPWLKLRGAVSAYSELIPGCFCGFFFRLSGRSVTCRVTVCPSRSRQDGSAIFAIVVARVPFLLIPRNHTFSWTSSTLEPLMLMLIMKLLILINFDISLFFLKKVLDGHLSNKKKGMRWTLEMHACSWTSRPWRNASRSCHVYIDLGFYRCYDLNFHWIDKLNTKF